jgi:DNA polymerase elongation subunit (family B)
MIHIHTRDNKLNISYFNEKGLVEIDRYEIPKNEMYEWSTLDKNKARKYKEVNWYDQNVTKTPTNRSLSKFRVQEYMEKNQHIFGKYNKYNFPKIWYCDIETAFVNGSYSKPEVADNPVLSIALVSDTGNVICLGLKPVSNVNGLEKNVQEHLKPIYKDWTNIKIKYKTFENEYDMMYYFFGELLPNIGCLTGWNFTEYDWMYLANRALKLNIEPKIASPARDYANRKTYIPLHKLIVDYMFIFEKWDKSLKVKENVSLDYISSEVLGVKKVKYSDSLHNLYTKNFDEFIYYNIIDTFLVKLIEDKVKLFNVVLKLANNALVPIEKGFKPVAMTESHYNREFLKREQVFTSKIRSQEDIDADKLELIGGYVSEIKFDAEVKPGKYKWVACLDFSSLYPSIQMQFNISPDTLMPKERAEFLLAQGKKISKCASGYYFDNEKDGVARVVLKRLFTERKQIQKKWKSIEFEISNLEKELESLIN